MKSNSTFYGIMTVGLLLGSTMLTGCEQPESGLESPAVSGARSAAVNTLVSAFPIGGYNTSAKGAYDVKAYRILYRTSNIDGSSIIASGLLLVPDKITPSPLMSLQHYTIEVDWQAPSYYQSGTEGYTIGNRFATKGCIVAAADYIGYGASRNVPHLYEHRNSLATAGLDMLRATRQFLTQSRVNWDSRLCLTGYSEGGFATLALQKKLEEEVPGEFNLVASSAGAGAHDKPAFVKYIINNKTSGNADYNSNYIWTLLTYDKVYGLNRPVTYYFKEPYATLIAQRGKEVSISASLHSTLTDTFRQAVNDGTDTAFLNAVEDNDVHDWKPRVPTRLYHGDADQLVFYFNSQNAYNAMKLQQAPDVSLITLRGKNHNSAATDFLNGTEAFLAQILD